jgi:hypothetical protein
MRLPPWGALWLLAVIPLSAQTVQEGPDYAGFYTLNIPGFQITEGAKITAIMQRVSGRLAGTDTPKPHFLTDQNQEIPLTFYQISLLLFDPSSQKPFDLEGFDVTAQNADGQARHFYVVYDAVMDDHRKIPLPPLAPPKQNGGGAVLKFKSRSDPQYQSDH